MFGRRTVEEIVNKVCNHGGVHDMTPATKDDIRQIVSDAIYQVLSSGDFIDYVAEEIAKKEKRTRTGYGSIR